MKHLRNKNSTSSPGRARWSAASAAPLAAIIFIAVALLVAAALFVPRGHAQEAEKLNRFVQTTNPAAAKLLREGRDLIGDENWQAAEDKFKSFVSLYPKDKSVDAALYWLAFALVKQEKYTEAEARLKRVVSEFSRSNWADDASALRAQIAAHVNPAIIDESLDTDDVEVKIVALESLFRSNPERGISYVTEMMKPASKASPRLKEAGIEMLRRHGGARATSLLIEIIRNHPDRSLRVNAIHTLGRTRDPNALPLLRDLVINSTDDETSKAAVFAISRFEDEGARSMLSDIARNGKSIEVRKEAIFWLSNVPSDAVLDELMRLYETERDTNIRKQIVFALKRIGNARAIGKLYEIARGADDTEVRKDALHWLGQSGDAQSVDFLIQLYDGEKNQEVKQQAIFALSRTTNKRALRKMIDIAKTDGSVELRKQAIFWLGRSNDPEAQKFIEGLLN